MPNMTLNLSMEQVNLILNALGNAPLPYLQSAPIIAEIQRQGNEQLNPPPPPPPSEEPTTPSDTPPQIPVP